VKINVFFSSSLMFLCALVVKTTDKLCNTLLHGVNVGYIRQPICPSSPCVDVRPDDSPCVALRDSAHGK